MSTTLFTHPACLNHLVPPGHPERPQRLAAILRALDTEAFQALERREAPLARREDIALVHPMAHVDAVLSLIPVEGMARLDADTAASPGSGEAALRAVGAVIAAVDAVLARETENAFCAVRPPGHHAEPSHVMGFCLFNNIAVGAAHARARHGLKRVAVIDFDVHHGNGTQAMFSDDPNLFYGSTHQSPLYPGTGRASEHGIARNIVNAPLPPGAGGREFRDAFGIVLAALDAFAPELVMVSAGFDAHTADPLANLNLTEPDFSWATLQLMGIADRHCDGRVVSTLEGGYDLHALAASAVAHVGALMRQ